MAGIVNSQVQQAPAQPAPAQPGAQPQPGAQDKKTQQTMYDYVAVAALKAMFNPQQFLIILARIAKGRNDPVGTMGQMAAMFMQSVEGKAKQQGKAIPQNILVGVLREIVSNLLQIAVSAQVVQKEQAQQLAKAISTRALQVYGQTAGANSQPQSPPTPQQQQPQPGAQPPAQQGQPMMGAQ